MPDPVRPETLDNLADLLATHLAALLADVDRHSQPRLARELDHRPDLPVVVALAARPRPRHVDADDAARVATRAGEAGTRTPTCAVVFVASAGERTRLQHMSHLRATGRAATVTAVGFITLDEIIDMLAEPSSDLVDRTGAAAVGDAKTPASDGRGIGRMSVRVIQGA